MADHIGSPLHPSLFFVKNILNQHRCKKPKGPGNVRGLYFMREKKGDFNLAPMDFQSSIFNSLTSYP